MNASQVSEVELLKAFFDSPLSQKGTHPLKNGIEIGLNITDSAPLTLTKSKGTILILEGSPKSPDMTFWIGKKGVRQLVEVETNDIGEVGIAIIKLMLAEDPEVRLKSKVHIGTLQLLTHGYLSIVPLGGSTVMKFLASKGFSNIGKIKDAISHLRG